MLSAFQAACRFGVFVLWHSKGMRTTCLFVYISLRCFHQDTMTVGLLYVLAFTPSRSPCSRFLFLHSGSCFPSQFENEKLIYMNFEFAESKLLSSGKLLSIIVRRKSPTKWIFVSMFFFILETILHKNLYKLFFYIEGNQLSYI